MLNKLPHLVCEGGAVVLQADVLGQNVQIHLLAAVYSEEIFLKIHKYFSTVDSN